MRFLVVEDEISLALALQSLLKDYGECTIVHNGKEAIEHFQKSLLEVQHFNMIFLDIIMPEMDGHEVLKSIRSIEKISGINEENSVKIIVTSSTDTYFSIYTAFKNNCQDYIIKPLSQADIDNIIFKYGPKKRV